MSKRSSKDFLKPSQSAIAAHNEERISSSAPYALIIFSVTLAFRLYYIFQLNATNLFQPHAGGLDDAIIDMMAQSMLRGDWKCGDPPLVIYYTNSFYAYALWAIYSLFGHSYLAVYILQALLGAAACVVVYYSALILAGRAAAVLASVLTALYGPLFYTTGFILGENLCFFTFSSSFLCLTIFSRSLKTAWIFLGVFFLAVSMMLRPNVVIASFVIGLWGIFTMKNIPWRRLLRFVFAAFCAALIVLAPISARNYHFAGTLSPFSSNLGVNLYGMLAPVPATWGNLYVYLRDSIITAEKNEKRRLSPGEVSGFWLRKAGELVRTRRGVEFLSKFIFNNALDLINSAEKYDIWSISFIGHYVPLLRFPFIPFSVIASLACAGMFLGWKKRRDFALLYCFILGYALSLLPFTVSSRYRMLIVPFLAISAGYAVTELPRSWKGSKVKAGAAVLIMIAVFVIAFLPRKTFTDAEQYINLGNRLGSLGRAGEAEELYKKALALAPHSEFPYYNLGILFKNSEKYEQALPYFEKTISINPSFNAAKGHLYEIYNNLANRAARAGKSDEAVELYKKAIANVPGSAYAHYNLGVLYKSIGKREEAKEYFKRALSIDPNMDLARKQLEQIDK